MVSVEYSKAIAEVLDILEHTKKEDVDKISPSFMKFLKENTSKEYIPKLDHNKRIKEMKIREKTIGILSIINSKFWCNDKEKEIFYERLNENEEDYQKVLREKYNPDNLFKNREGIERGVQCNQLKETDMIEYKGKNFIQKIFDRIKHLLKRERM